MSDFKSIQSEFSDIYKNIPTKGTTIIIEGESGVGKSFLVDKFIEDNKDDFFVVKITGVPFERSPYNTLNKSLISLISNKIITEKLLYKAASELICMIPKFGLFFGEIIKPNLTQNTKTEILKGIGIALDTPNISSLIRFIENMAQNKTICLYCDNIQWIDKESYQTILEIILSDTNKKWLRVLLYTTGVEITPTSHKGIKDNFSYIIKQKRDNTFCFTFNRWIRADIQIICSSILSGKCSFTSKQYDVLYQNTQGLALYIANVLDVLKQRNIVEFENNVWESKIDWDTDTVLGILKNSVSEKIKTVYQNMPESKKILEVASVIGEIFSEEQIDNLFEIKDSFSVLNEVEIRSQLIQYIMQNNSWKFGHYLTYNCIYHSISKVKELHQRIAIRLQEKENMDYDQIALHFGLSGDYYKFTIFKIKEIKQLLDIGCYSAALNIVEEINCNSLLITLLDSEEQQNFYLLEGRCLFHSKSYEKSIQVFMRILKDENADSTDKNAECQKWLGKAHLKLSTQQAFHKGICYLKKAEIFHKTQKQNSQLGYIYMDLIVAYAHINKREEAQNAYEIAIEYFNAAKNTIGMLQLQRRNVIFMEHKVAAPIIAQSADMFERLGHLHEMIMSLNNAATQYLFLKDYSLVTKMLDRCIKASEKIGGFGLVYINNNLGVLNCFQKKYADAESFFEAAEKEKPREVEQLIICINKSTIIARNSCEKAIPLLLEIYNKSLNVGEDEYIIPAAINLSKQYVKISDYISAQELLLSIENKIETKKSYYKTFIWYTLLKTCCIENNSFEILHKIEEKHLPKIKSLNTTQPYIYDDYIILTMQFWSEG